MEVFRYFEIRNNYFLIPSNENSDSFISNLNFKFEKKKYMENQSNLRTAFRINIYNSLDEK